MSGWTITWGERSWTDDDVLVADLADISILLGSAWENCEPSAGPAQLMTMIAVLEARTSGRPLDDVIGEVRIVPAAQLVAALGTREAG